MTTIKIFIGSFLILILLSACGNKQTDNNATAKQETPEALQSDKINLRSYGRSGNLTDELYQELVSKNPELEKLEDDLEAFGSKLNELEENFQKYDSKSTRYYNSTNHKAAAITDSLLKIKIIALIASSNKKYTAKTEELNSLLKQISNNGATLSDHHAVLKIVTTLPIIEKYQNDYIPEKQEFKGLINQQEHLILRTDSLTPKY